MRFRQKTGTILRNGLTFTKFFAVTPLIQWVAVASSSLLGALRSRTITGEEGGEQRCHGGQGECLTFPLRLSFQCLNEDFK